MIKITDDMIEIVAIGPDHIESFHRTLDTIARERRYLAMLEAPPIENLRSFVQDNISHGHAQFAALSDGEVVGWCVSRAGHRAAAAATDPRGGARPRPVTRGVDDNPGAIALYEKSGFVAEGVQRNAFKVDGRYYNLIMMAVLFPD
jgi:hypothetical protein